VASCGDATDVLATLHPRAVALFRERPQGSPRNVWHAPVLALEPALDCVRVQVGGAVPLVAEITPAAQADLRLAVGEAIWLAVKATEIQTSPG
jgi:molybdate transport system ATP-binding protein